MKSKLDFMKANNPIMELQIYLNDLSQSYSDMPGLLPTGVYDNQTVEAVKVFQKKYTLPVTGKIDFNTWKKLINEHGNCSNNTSTAQCVSCFPSNIQEYKLNDKSNLIYILQIILNNYANKYMNYKEIPITGVLDQKTEEAVREFQKLAMLPVTGTVDRPTWNRLNKINQTCKLYE